MRRRTRWMAGVASATLLIPNVSQPADPAAAGAAPPLHAVPLTGSTLSLGDQGQEVKLVQRRLRVAVDGRFGPRTRRAVQALQRAAGLAPDGVVGPLTWAALGQAGGTGSGAAWGRTLPPGTSGRPDLSLGASGPAVAEAQRLLTTRGFRTTADGRFGPSTHASVVAFQRRRNLTADGVVGPLTWTALGTAANALALQLVSTSSPLWRIVGSRSYVVQRTDTWSSIAAAKGTTAAALAVANRLSFARPPPIGSRIQVPGAWRCPLIEGNFMNDYGFPRPAGRVHQGNDLFAARGTPIRAPVSGRAEQFPNPIGGNAVQLHGDDGNRYYFAHLDRYAGAGRVSAGSVIGYVGNSGNAITTPPHLHFEVHPGGGSAINPFPTITLACRR
ncbi:MAG: hypothetical protein AVDCRST_MAG76-102 [uncultured Acidimicrobiales bacterium]|uniref:LysM domain-containing protein n=1 Tax=uncultured Acidimicrobiales bacterium TaxID=310071 RepID=A0A6J4H3Z0_9ACTN|nr:MAG: hypothetical protein AVDCRST_MAG76-102 [uncultured Acidimicrobiales bacterium]